MKPRKITKNTPKNAKFLLLYGRLREHGKKPLHQWLQDYPHWHVGYWDNIDQAWCTINADWTGPFIDASHWTELPKEPRKKAIKSKT